MELPRDMLTEVICRLPISTLYKNFKSPTLLCLHNKEFHDIISDPNFPHLFQSYNNIHPCTFLAYDEDRHETFLIEYDLNTDEFISTQLNTMAFVKYLNGKNAAELFPMILASCNGWLLVRLLHSKINDWNGGSCFNTESIYLVNPITRRYATVVPDGSSHSSDYSRYMLGYIVKTGKFKVARFSANNYEILTVNDDDNIDKSSLHWRRTTSSNDPLYREFSKEILDCSESMVMLNGALYCLVDNQTQILKFDMDTEEFELVSTPYKKEEYDPAGFSCGYLGVVGESLYMGVHTWSEGFEFWVMKECCWTKLTTIHDYIVPKLSELIRVFENGKILILSNTDRKLQICDSTREQG